MTASPKSLPKWARRLTRRQWAALQRCQDTKHPTLSQLKSDLAYQREAGIVCHDCRLAAYSIGMDAV